MCDLRRFPAETIVSFFLEARERRVSPACYVTSAGVFLPGEPISNDDMEDYLGRIGGKDSRARERVLRQNGIRSRHYAIDRNQQTTISNAGMASEAIRTAVDRSDCDLDEVQLLVAATSQGDTPLPGFASMVHGELDMPPCEIATLHGICASGVAALRHAAAMVESGRVTAAACVASELPSRLFKASRYEAQGFGDKKTLPFETEFLRWMLSDGAGAFLLQDQPADHGLSLRLDWIKLKSYASQFPPCMYVGTKDEVAANPVRGWLDYDDCQSATAAGAINLRQNIQMLDDVVRLTVNGVFDLVDEGLLNPRDIDWYVTHYSSHVFREQAYELFCRGGLRIPLDRVFTNLYTKGNVGSASPFLMIEELFYSGQLEPGQTLFCIVPESGRFLFGYMQFTVVGTPAEPVSIPARPAAADQEIIPPDIKTSGSELEESLVRQLSHVWTDFENRLNQVPIVRKMWEGKLRLKDYQELLFNLRQQVIDGSRWISRAASNLTTENFPIRSAFIGHSSDEHRDFEMLEQNYVSVGGRLEDIQSGEKNIGSTALSEFVLGRASRENPFDLIGAMFIIEGLGRRVARRWAVMIKEQLDLDDSQVTFLTYHSESDDIHFQRLDQAVQSGILTPEVVENVVKTAKVTARLYLLQLEELGNF